MAPIAEKHKEIRTKRLMLRPLMLDDAQDMLDARRSPGAYHFIPRALDTSTDPVKEWITSCLTRPNCYTYAVTVLPDKGQGHAHKSRLIGGMGAIRTPEIGYLIHSAYWGQGIATEALQAYMTVYWEHVSELDPPLNYAVAYVDPENWASKKVLEKCGFKLNKVTENDIEHPTLGTRSTAHYWAQKPGTTFEGDLDASSEVWKKALESVYIS